MDWKLKNTDEKHVGRSILIYKVDLKAANSGQTDTQGEYYNTRAHARRALISMRAER